jgi:hypothetical protein
MAIDKPFKIGNLAYTLARQLLVKDKGGIASLPSQEQILGKVQDIFQMLKAGGFNPVSADKSIKSVNDLKKVLTDIEMKQQVEFNLAKNRSEGLETVLEKMDKGIPLNPSDQAKMSGVEKIADDEVLDAFKGFTPKVIEGGKGKKGIEKLIKDGDVTIGTAPKTINKKPPVDPELQAMTDQNEMFQDFSKRIKTMSPTDRVSERLKDLKGVNLSELSGVDAQKIASEVIGRKGPFKTISSKGAKEVLGELEPIIKRADAEVDLGTKLKNFDGDPDAMAQGGRIGFSNGSTGVGVAGDQTEQSQPGGGQMDMPRNLGFQPIFPMPQTNIPGSGGMSEFRKFLQSRGAQELGMGFNFPVGQRGILGVGVAPSGNVGAQLRLPFKDGSKPKSRARRNFLKLMAGLGSIPFVGPLFKGAKTVEKAATAVETVPPYFFQLVNKIRQFGTDITSPGVTTESRQRVIQYEIDGDDYVMTENLSTGKIEIEKEKTGGVQFYDEYGEMDVADGIISKEYMTYKPKEVDVDPKTGKKIEYPEEYEEVTATPSGDDGTDMEAISGLNDDTVKQIVKETGDLKGVKKYYPDVELTPREQLDKRIQEIIKQRNKKAGGGVAYMLGE